MVISCEHGGNHIPARYRRLFRGLGRVLAGHRGYDHGAAYLAKALACTFNAPCHIARESRLLVDLNRSLGNRAVFSYVTATLSPAEKAEIVKEFYLPYRRAVEDDVAAQVKSSFPVLHLSIHSYTPVLEGRTRRADIGILYDPSRSLERAFCRRWKQILHQRYPELRVRLNYPYRGISDGFTAYLRKRYAPARYCGIEIEVNQRLFAGSAVERRNTCRALCGTLQELLSYEARHKLPRHRQLVYKKDV